jgi:hypothetical protein
MSSIRWADRIRCDYPGCESMADTRIDEKNFTHLAPAGWLSLGRRSISVTDPFGRMIMDLCSLHASTPIDKLAALFTLEEASASGNRN